MRFKVSVINSFLQYCIRVFCRSLTLIFSDDRDEKLENTTKLESSFRHLILKNENTNEDEQKHSNTKTIRSDPWIATTMEKLSTLIDCLVSLCSHQQINVKKELVSGVNLVLKNCR